MQNQIEIPEPLFERIFVKVDTDESTSPSGLIIPTESKDMITSGVVIKVGTKMPDNSVEVGQKIIFQKHAGVDVKFGTITLRMMMVNDAFARYPVSLLDNIPGPNGNYSI